MRFGATRIRNNYAIAVIRRNKDKMSSDWKTTIERRRTTSLQFILFAFSLQCVGLFAQSARNPASAGSRAEYVTHTTFHGLGSPYSSASRADGVSGLAVDPMEAVMRGDRALLPWKYKIVATVFWVGEEASEQNPVSNIESAWDADWVTHYGGDDDPIVRLNFMPLDFVPKLNPFYVALPYNDLDEHHTKPDAAQIIPWFNAVFVRDGESVCKGRWVAIRHAKRVCYAQWEDVGPYQTDHWQYVFGGERPRPNANHDAGIDVSPAVRDYLGMSGMDVCDWKFVNTWEVPNGPWALHGDDNTVTRLRGELRIPKVRRPNTGLEATNYRPN
jgi:hypothetical protein